MVMRNRNQENDIYKILTIREIEITKLILKGYTSKQISNILSISFHTVVTHRKNIMRKTKCCCIGELFSFVINNDISTKLNIP